MLCTLGSRRIVGVVIAVRARGTTPKGAKPILSVLEGISLPEDLVVFVARLASYYLAPIGEVVRLALPPVDKEAARVVEEPTLFSEAKGISARQVQWVVADRGRRDVDQGGRRRVSSPISARTVRFRSRASRSSSAAHAPR